MIKITIEKFNRVEWEETEHKIIKKTPTAIDNPNADRYGDKKLYVEEFAPVVVKKSETRTVTLLTQMIEDNDQLDLASVIAAINKMQRVSV